jgi:hypothetical protein
MHGAQQMESAALQSLLQAKLLTQQVDAARWQLSNLQHLPPTPRETHSAPARPPR